MRRRPSNGEDPRAPPHTPATALTSSQPLARGLLRGADGWSAARSGASPGDLIGRLGLGRRSLALGEEICGRQRVQRVRAWRAGEPKEGSGGVSGGWPARVGASPPAPRSAAGQLCLRRLAMCCVSISPCPSAKPPGAAARLTPSLPRSPRSPRPAAPRKGLQWLGRGPRSEGAGARLPIPPAPASGCRAQQRAGTGCRRSRALRAAGPLMPREEAGTK